MNKKNIKDVFEYHLKDLKVDKELIDKLRKFRYYWSQKDINYIEFLGSGLLGVHPIRFSTNDEDLFFVDILNIDKNMLKTDLHALEGINKSWKVTSNNVYLTVMYLIYKFYNSNLKINDKLDGIRECYYIFAFKVISSLVTHYFSYNVDTAIAKAVYEKMSNKFILKKLGTWQAFIEYRANDVLPNGLHYNNLNNITTDSAVKAIADLQSRIRDAVKNSYTVLLEVKEQNEKINSSSVLEHNEDDVGIKDVSNRPDIYVNYIKSIYKNTNDFINDDIIYLLESTTNRLDVDMLIATLKYISNHADINKYDFIEYSINSNIKYLFTKNIRTDYNKHVLEIIKYLKGYWSASIIKDQTTKELKKHMLEITKKATNKKTLWSLAIIVNSVYIYIFIRSLSRNKY